MKILIASTPATGRLNPLLAIGHILIAEGHEVVGLSGSALRERIENVGAEFRPLPEGTDFDLRDILSVAPELKDTPPGPYRSRGGIQNSLRNFPRNSRFWEKLQDHGDRRSHRRRRQNKANLSCRGLGGRNAAALWRHLTTAA